MKEQQTFVVIYGREGSPLQKECRIVRVIMGQLAGHTDIRHPFNGSKEGITSNNLYCLSPLCSARHPQFYSLLFDGEDDSELL